MLLNDGNTVLSMLDGGDELMLQISGQGTSMRKIFSGCGCIIIMTYVRSGVIRICECTFLAHVCFVSVVSGPKCGRDSRRSILWCIPRAVFVFYAHT
jgi:hypothetical protein